MLLAVLPLTREAAAIRPWFSSGAGNPHCADGSASLVLTKHHANGKHRNHVSCRSGNDLPGCAGFSSVVNSAKGLSTYTYLA